MCRLLCVRGREDFDPEEHLAAFTRIAKESREFQGHGWGCAWLEGGRWRLYHNVRPIWEDDWRPPGRTTLLLAHARSAFRDEGIRVENNMPFHDGERVFIFNGELRGVRIKERGRIGADTAQHVHVATSFREDPEYFQMHSAELADTRVICSEPYPGRARGAPAWTHVPNGTVATF